MRVYDPTTGRFLSHDPLGRAPLFFAGNPYVYAGNNPLSNVDPSGQRMMGASNSQVKQAALVMREYPPQWRYAGDLFASIRYTEWVRCVSRFKW